MNSEGSLSWLLHYGCPIIHEYKVSTVLCKIHQEIVPGKHFALVVEYLGGFMLENCWCLLSSYRKFPWMCRRAKGNKCSSKVSAWFIAFLEGYAKEKGVAVIFALPLPAHASNLILTWQSRAAPAPFLGTSISGEVISWICSLIVNCKYLNCKYSITRHRERLFTYACAVPFACQWWIHIPYTMCST